MFRQVFAFLIFVGCYFSSVSVAGELNVRYFGGSGDERGQVVAEGIDGSIYIAGSTTSTDLPVLGATVSTLNPPANSDIYIARFPKNAVAPDLVTYLGNTGSSYQPILQSLRINSGKLYVLLISGDADGGGRIIKLSSDLAIEKTTSVLAAKNGWSTAYDIDVDSVTGEVYVAGEVNRDPTNTDDYFVNYSGSAQVFSTVSNSALKCQPCAFVVKYSADLNNVNSATVLGPDIKAFTVRHNPVLNKVYIGGEVNSKNMIKAVNESNGGQDGFVAAFSSDLSSLDKTIFIGGDGLEGVNGIVFNTDFSSMYIAGLSGSQSINSVDAPLYGGTGQFDNFIARLSLDLAKVEAYTFLRAPFADTSKGVVSGAWDYYRAGFRNSVVDVNPKTGDIGFATFTDTADLSKPMDNFSNGAAINLEVFRLTRDLKSVQKNVLIGGSDVNFDGGIAFSSSGTGMYVVGTTYSMQNFPKAINKPFSLDSAKSDAVLIQMSGDYVITDEDPNHFVFMPKSDVLRGKDVFSGPITVTDLSNSVAVSISGDGAYWKAANAADKCEEDFAKYTKEVQTVKNGDIICVGHISSANFNAKNTTTLTIGSYSADFVTTTEKLKDYPDELTSDYYVKSVANQIVAWGVFPINGINTPVTVSVVGGEYALNCTDRVTNPNYTAASTANVVVGTSICIRHNAGSPGEHLVTNLTIGSRTFAFSSDAIDISKSSSGNGGGGGGGGSIGIFFAALGALLMLRKSFKIELSIRLY